MIDRVWELLSYAVQETAVASRIPEADAFEQLKAWVVDGKVQARGHWPEGPGVASSTDPVCILPHDEFRFVDRIWNRLLFLRPMKIVDDVEINIVQLRRALAENAGQPAAPVAETVPPDQSKPPKDCKKRGPQPLKRSQVKEAMRKFGLQEVRQWTEEACVVQFGASRSVCRKALAELESEFVRD